MIFKKSLFYFITALNALFFCACASNGNVAQLETLYYDSQNLDSAYSYAKKYADDDFLWALQSGILAYQVGEFESAIKHLNGAEVFFEGVSGENAFNSGFKSFASVLLSNGMFEYGGAFYESVFINHYKALNAIMSGDFQSARVEFNRANDRQRRAKDYFADYIAKRDESISQNISEYRAEAQNADISRSYNSAMSAYGEHYQNLRKYRAFDGYVNPYISYISGIFFLSQGDFEKAQNLLKEAYAITEKSEILRDMALLKARKNGDKNKYTWIVIEEGRIPKKEEVRLDLPLFLVNTSVLSFNLTLPILREYRAYTVAYNAKVLKIAESRLDSAKNALDSADSAKNALDSAIRIKSAESTTDSAKIYSFEIADISPLVANEFEIELPYIIITSLLSSSYKAYLQYFLGEKFGGLGSLAGAIFSYASTRADIRSARILPLRFFAIRVSNKNGDFALYNGNVRLQNFHFDCEQICAKNDNIIYARIIQNDIISILTHILK